jgi:hypothetical protein
MEQKETNLKKYVTPQMDEVEVGPQLEILSGSCPTDENGIVCTE